MDMKRATKQIRSPCMHEVRCLEETQVTHSNYHKAYKSTGGRASRAPTETHALTPELTKTSATQPARIGVPSRFHFALAPIVPILHVAGEVVLSNLIAYILARVASYGDTPRHSYFPSKVFLNSYLYWLQVEDVCLVHYHNV